jgi:hypothetical protein
LLHAFWIIRANALPESLRLKKISGKMARFDLRFRLLYVTEQNVTGGQ